MRRSKHSKRKNKVFEAYSVIILIATLFMGIAYAEITGTQMIIEGTAIANIQEGVFISDAQYLSSDTSTDETKSNINYYTKTVLDSEIELGTNSSSYITYEISVYNNTDTEQMFIGAFSDDTDLESYTNSNITYSLNINKYTTTILPKEELKFEITFEYLDSTNITDTNLKSKINFRFKEKPILVLEQDGTIENIYPDCEPKEYTFAIKNYVGEKINSVPMDYTFDIEIDKPLTAKIYNQEGEEITKGDAVIGEATETTYTIKVMWDNTNPEEGIEYNNAQYAKETFNCKINLISKPNGDDKEKYDGYTIQDNINLLINPVSFDFSANVSSQNLVIKNGTTSLTMTINNSTPNNIFNINYEIEKIENDNFSFNIGEEGAENNKIGRTLLAGETTDSFDISFNGDIQTINPTETLKLKITLTDVPYTIEPIIFDITIKLHSVTITFNATGGTVSPETKVVYYGRTYGELPTPIWKGHTFNGWFSSKSGGTQYEDTTSVTEEGATQTLYAQWTSYLLADNVSVGDYVNYPVSYDNVYGYQGTNYISNLTGWRVWSIEGEGDEKYVRLISAGVPLTYDHIYGCTLAQAKTAVKRLTTNFFDTEIKSTSTDTYFNLCGFKDANSNKVTNIATLETLFTNDYTQTTSTGRPVVQSITKLDLDLAYYGDSNNDGKPDNVTTDGTFLEIRDLIHLKATDNSNYYVPYYLADYALLNSKYYLYICYIQGAVVVTGNNYGVRPIVSLKPDVEITGRGTGTKQAWKLK